MTSFNDIKCCDGTRNINQLLQSYQNVKGQILKLLGGDQLSDRLWKDNTLLQVDDKCQCNMGKFGDRTVFMCPQCTSIGNISENKRTFIVQCGNEVGKQFAINEFSIGKDVGIMISTHAKSRADIILSKNSGLFDCGTTNVDVKYYRSDPFTNHILQSWIVEDLFQSKGLPHYLKLWTGFICRNYGFTLEDRPISLVSLGDLVKYPELATKNAINSKVIKSIILQLIVIYTELGSIQFTHGNPSLNTIGINLTPCSYQYNNVMVSGPLTVYLNNFEYSSSTVSNCRLYSSAYYVEQSLERSILIPEVKSALVEIKCSQPQDSKCFSPTTIYQVPKDTIKFFNAIRHTGVPLFVNSFDFYASVVSLMTNSLFYRGLTEDTDLYLLWSSLFMPSDRIKVMSRLRSGEQNVMNILADINLRCDILNYLWNRISILV